MLDRQKELIPKLGPGVAAMIYDPTLWKWFARKCQKNPVMREVIFSRDLKNGCQWCGKLIVGQQRWNIHHKDYDHFCAFGQYVEIRTPTPKRINRYYKGPNCGLCKIKNPEFFDRCSSRLALVHRQCNYEIELARVKGSRNTAYKG